MKKGKGKNNGGLLPNSLRIISSCLKTVSTNATTVASSVRSAGASVAASISSSNEDLKDQIMWAGFDKLEQSPSIFKHVLLLGYQNGFQVLDVEDASSFSELVSKRDGPVSFLQMQSFPAKSDGHERYKFSHPLLLVVAGDDTTTNFNLAQNHSHPNGLARDSNGESPKGKYIHSPTSVRFYSLKTHCYEHVLRFRSAVRMVRCSPHIVAVGLATQIYCIDALTLENKFSVLTYPVPQITGQGAIGINLGYGPMAVGPRWLAYASNNPLYSNNGRLSPQSLTPSPGVSPSTSPGGNSLMARYAMESSKQLASGLMNLGDMGYKALSKYCQEMLPDGSNSPVSPSAGWKFGKGAGTDTDNAGMVVIKDFVSGAIISQFKAHTSPISALCFDPSGTLLVTASIYGNNMNVFRIMASRSESGAGVQRHDWSSAHVHLYKLHRGMTTAMIQDICFSHFSQWVAIVSSKGTCHIFVLSPFGGDSGFQSFNCTDGEPSFYPVLSLPWWSTSSCIINQNNSPPPPVSVSVVSRIKYSSFGWLSTVGNTSGSSMGKVFVPSGAVAAVFHNSLSKSVQDAHSRTKSLEYLLVFTPSGHVVQHHLLPSIGLEPENGGSGVRSSSFMHIQEDDLKVKVEPIHWWDVCRRADWPEREETTSAIVNGHHDTETIQSKLVSDDKLNVDLVNGNPDFVEQKSIKSYCQQPHEKQHSYLSNAEVQINSGILSIWQTSKIGFYVMESPTISCNDEGEFEIENIAIHEVEINRKELLPVFDHYHSIKSGWPDRESFVRGGVLQKWISVTLYIWTHFAFILFVAFFINLDRNPSEGGYTHSLLLEPHQSEGKNRQEIVICHSQPASLGSTESSECGSSRRTEHLLDLDQTNCEKTYVSNCQTINDFYQEKIGSAIDGSAASNPLYIVSFPADNLKHGYGNSFPLSDNDLPSAGSTGSEGAAVMDSITNGVSALMTNGYETQTNVPVRAPIRPMEENLAGLMVSFLEGHCEAVKDDGCCATTNISTDDVLTGICKSDTEKVDDDGENDDPFGGLFAFSEEAST